ncbi:unnamed protein product [Rotaria socialis]|uniref:Helix-turn-helix domain-containing protein n=1 Tax=Rotaria socialis TaxID=392032 RepID=A0A818PWS3_9BILA|nr:unnamed protein product [Rotaria socialis]
MLDEANNFHPNIKLVREIGRSVPFLDVLIENRKGTLTTSVYHKEVAEPYVVPFGSDHLDHVFRNTVDTAITRAVRYSTTLSEFKEEIRQMKLMFLYNGYPARHIHRQLTTLVIENRLTGYPHLIPRSDAILKQYSDHLLDYLNQSYFTPLSYKDQLISREQAQILGSIRRIIQNMNLIIRVTDKANNFYIGSAGEFEQKARKFFSDTNAFTELSSNPFNEILNKVIQLLNTLRGKDLIRKWQYEQMMPDRTTDKILRPIFDAKCKDTTIIDGATLITELSKYNKKGLLKSTTLFCTFDIRNLYAMLPQEETLDILITFLHAHGYRKAKGINIDTIKKLASIILKDNAFAYGKKIYKQTTGGAMGSSLTLTSANLFMAKWQKNIVEEQTKTGEFYGRYIDDIFMTWNRSEEELRKFLDDVNTWHPNIKLDYKIGNSLPFLDVKLTNHNGILSTSVYHKSAAEPYVIPFTSDHPRHVFINIIQTCLARAVRYSSTFEAFNYGRHYIKLMLLYNE